MADEVKGTQEEVEVTEEQVPTEEPTYEEQTLDESQVSSMIQNLVSDSKPEQEAEEVTPQPEEEEQPKENEIQPVELVVDDTIIEKYPVLRGLSGKKITDVFQSYDNLVKKMTEQGKEISKLKQQETKPQVVVKEEEELPDPVDDAKAYAKAVEERAEKKAEEKFNKLVEEFKKSQPKVDEQQEAVRQQELFLNDVQLRLPKEVKAIDVVKEYMKDKANLFYDEYGQPREKALRGLDENPELFIDNVVTHFEAKRAKKEKEDAEKLRLEAEKNKEKEVKTKVYQKTKENFQKAKNRQPEGSEVNLAPRQEPELTEEDKLYADIYKSNANLDYLG